MKLRLLVCQQFQETFPKLLKQDMSLKHSFALSQFLQDAQSVVKPFQEAFKKASPEPDSEELKELLDQDVVVKPLPKSLLEENLKVSAIDVLLLKELVEQ